MNKTELFLRQILRNQMDIMDALPGATWIEAKEYEHDLHLRRKETKSLLSKEKEK